ncbi:MAG: hypothetical protein ACR2QM_13715 [Longimicrobiales bacterium]
MIQLSGEPAPLRWAPALLAADKNRIQRPNRFLLPGLPDTFRTPTNLRGQELMKASATDYLGALAIAALAAVGGAAVVLAEFDDAPGGILIGFLLILGSAGLHLRARKRQS